MTVFIIRRLMQAGVVVILMSFIVFSGVFLVGDPVDILISDEADEEDRERAIAALGLDKPFHVQYLVFLRNAAQGNLGDSFIFEEPALLLILERMPATFELAIFALLIAVVLGIPLGMLAGLRPNSIASKSIMTGSILGFSLPTFWVGIMMMMLFAVVLGWLPSTGRGPTTTFLGMEVSFTSWRGISHLLMPAVNLSLFKLALVIRLARAGTREVIHQDYIKFARAKGISGSRIILVHLLKNILIPVVTVLGLEFGGLVAFSVVTETVFAWPGMGKLLIDSIGMLDRPVIVAYLMMIVFLFVVINLVVDILYSLLDPRVRLSGNKSMTDSGIPSTEIVVTEVVRESAQTPFQRFLSDYAESPVAVVSFVVVLVVGHDCVVCAVSGANQSLRSGDSDCG
ncbi:MAG: ABC transporter permease [Pseudomonadota bacterium]|nr:MAG: ABC transporter permease [Pseudomonadota bacterium]